MIERQAMIRLSVLAIICLVTLGCSREVPVHDTKPAHDGTATEQNREWLIGRWLGQATLDDGSERLWLVERAPDGKFKITFRTYSELGFDEKVEVGLWGVEEDIYFTITTGWLYGEDFFPADMTDHVYYDVYEIVHIDGTSLEYLSKGTVARYKLTKVDNSYRLPD